MNPLRTVILCYSPVPDCMGGLNSIFQQILPPIALY